MISSLTTLQKSQLNQMNRGFNYGSGSASGFSQLIADILSTLGTGEIGITSNAYDVDSVCNSSAGAFSQDADTTSGLTFGYYQGSFYNGQTAVSVAAGTIALNASTTNYIEVDSAGTVHCSTGGFTANRLPLYEIVTGSSAITSITNVKTLLVLLGAGSIPGAMLSAAASSKAQEKDLGTLTTTTTFMLIAPCTGTLVGATLICPTGVAANNSNYWTASAIEVGAAGTGTQPLLAASAANTTQSTGGFSLTSNVPQALTLIALSGGDTQRNVTEGDLITVTFTATGSPPALTGSQLRLKFSFTD